MIVTNLRAFAGFECAMIIERTQGGKAIARQKEGFGDGMSSKYSRIQLCHATELIKDHPDRHVEDITGISISTLEKRKHKCVE